VERIREYVDTGNIPELTAEEVGLIENAGTERNQSFFKNTKYCLKGI
jgi:hypothetical protein